MLVLGSRQIKQFHNVSQIFTVFFVANEVKVNAVIYGSILKGFSRKKHMDRVWEAFDEMKAHGS